MTRDPDNVQNAEAQLAEYERVAHADHWPGDREPYLTRTLAVAQVYATLAVAEALYSIERERQYA